MKMPMNMKSYMGSRYTARCIACKGCGFHTQ